MKLTIGNVTLENNLILAPMAGVTDLPFRLLCKEQGAGLLCTEMVSAKAIYFKNKNTKSLMQILPRERPVSLQLFGSEPELMGFIARQIEEQPFDILDINMGCPARKIVSKGDGSALMRDPDLAAVIVRAVKAAVAHPVTVKFRRGWAEGDETAPAFARRMEAAGADAVAVHGRFAEQLYRGAADWDVIARVREVVGVPVVGNGDVRSGADAVRMIAETGCDAVMIARGAEGNPWLFSQVQAALAGVPEPAPPTVEERIAMARRHAELLTHREGRNIVRMRKHAMWYMAGLPGAAAARGRINYCTTLDDFNQVFDDLLRIAQEHS